MDSRRACGKSSRCNRRLETSCAWLLGCQEERFLTWTAAQKRRWSLFRPQLLIWCLIVILALSTQMEAVDTLYQFRSYPSFSPYHQIMQALRDGHDSLYPLADWVFPSALTEATGRVLYHDIATICINHPSCLVFREETRWCKKNDLPVLDCDIIIGGIRSCHDDAIDDEKVKAIHCRLRMSAVSNVETPCLRRLS